MKLLLLLFSFIRFAAPGSTVIRDKATDSQTNAGLIGATILIKELGKAVTSRLYGSFNLKDINPGSFTHIYSYICSKAEDTYNEQTLCRRLKRSEIIPR